MPALALLAACTNHQEEEAAFAPNDLSRPAYTIDELPDEAAWHVPGAIVVDFTDGTTKEQFDALEQQWGIDLELASEEEGVDSAITVATPAW